MIARHCTYRGVVWLLVLSFCAGTCAADEDWTEHGADKAGTRYSPLARITRDNVGNLEVAWVYRSGEMVRREDRFAQSKDSNIPFKIDDHVVVCTPFNRVISLHSATGKEQWTFDANVTLDLDPRVPYACRGVAYWRDDGLADDVLCQKRLIFGTSDLRLFAIDLETGRRCPQFGANGEVSAPASKPQSFQGEVRYLMPPTIINGVAVLGSAIEDSHRPDTPSGKVQAFSARTGEKLWEFDPIPKHPDDPAMATWGNDSAYVTGSGNVWAFMAADEKRDLVFLPTSSPAPDPFGGLRPGRNEYTDSLVALRGATGELAWHFQIAHHDLWGFDVASQPLLVDIPRNGITVPAVVQNTKQGMVFVFNRETGEPLFPIEERPVPAGDIPGEWYSPTQPFPVKPLPLIPHLITPDQAWGFTFWDRKACRKKIKQLRYGGIYIPPSVEGSVSPWSGGGANWGGPAYDPKRNWMIINTNRIPAIMTLIPVAQATEEKLKGMGITGATIMAGTPYALRKSLILSPFGTPCTAPPWGGLTAVNLTDGTIVWDVPLGSVEEFLPLPLTWRLGVPSIGGPIVTASGLIFIAATFDRTFRAFDIETGEELWSDKLPAASQTTPITYEANGRQFVVLTSGGHGQLNNKRGDYVVAYALPE